MTYTFDFNSRETYLVYRAAWRFKYAQISQEIRDLKKVMASMKGKDVSSEQYSLHLLRRKANNLMLELEAAKTFKNEQLAAAVEA
jgi:hypothetical protein